MNILVHLGWDRSKETMLIVFSLRITEEMIILLSDLIHEHRNHFK